MLPAVDDTAPQLVARHVVPCQACTGQYSTARGKLWQRITTPCARRRTPCSQSNTSMAERRSKVVGIDRSKGTLLQHERLGIKSATCDGELGYAAA